MRRHLSLFCAVCLLVSLVTATSCSNVQTEPEDDTTAGYAISPATLADFSRGETAASGVLEINSGEYADALAIQQNAPHAFEDFLQNNGVILYRTDENSAHRSLDELLHCPVQDALRDEQAQNSNADPGIDVAALYYLRNGAVASHTINISSDLYEEQENIIYEILLETLESRDELALTSNPVLPTYSSDIPVSTYLTTKSYSSVRAPYGKLTVDYAFYIVESFHSRNYYMIYPLVNGCPGYQMGAASSSYDTQYRSKKLDLDISTPTDGVRVIKYDINKNLWGNRASVHDTCTEGDIAVGAHLRPASVNWEVVCNRNGREKAVALDPGIIFVSPESRTSISADAQLDYTITNGLPIFWEKEVVSIDRSFTVQAPSAA